MLHGVPLPELQHYAASVQAVPAAAVVTAAERVIDPTLATVVVVGDARQFADALRKSYPTLEVIPATALNLETGTLR